MSNPFFSICIPAYKRSDLLKRLLRSIDEQHFRDFEVVVSDDSPDDTVENTCKEYNGRFKLRYERNTQALGTPENWNQAIRQARGQWIKIMHDDDWFSGPDSLLEYKKLTEENRQVSFFFTASTIVHEDGREEHYETNSFCEKLLKADPANLFHKNFIGPPSVILYKADSGIEYDKRMKWLVDVDFYIRYLNTHPGFGFTRMALVKVGFNPAQVTNAVIHDAAVVIPETLLLLQKTGTDIFRKIWNFDAAWRLMRNYQVRSWEELAVFKPNDSTVKIPAVFRHILSMQRFIPLPVLRIGVFSKFFMFINYLGYRIQPGLNGFI